MQNTQAPFPVGSLPVVLCDQLNAEAVIIDLAAHDPTAPNAILWRWAACADNGFEGLGYKHRIDDCKLRYSERLGVYVACVTSSSGFMGIAEFPSGKKIWEAFAMGYGPHSIDYLPSGNVVVALSGNGHPDRCELRIYACDESGVPTQEFYSLPYESAHGIVRDSDGKRVWALSNTCLTAFAVGGTTKAPTLEPIDGTGVAIPPPGHDLSLSPADPNRFYISSRSVYLFDRASNTLAAEFDGSELIKAPAVKCIAEHTDGSLLRTAATGVYAPHDTDRLDVFRKAADGRWTKATYVFEGRAFYKARPVIL